MKLNYKIKENDKYDNIKQLLRNEFNISERLFLRLKRNNKILINSYVADFKTRLQSNDIIEIYLDYEEDSSNIVPFEIKLNIVYEDDAFLIINKPAGIATHPSILHYNNSISNGVKFYFNTINLNKKIRPVNRLDKDTSRTYNIC